MDIRTLQALASGQLTSLEAKYRKMRILGRGSFGVVWLVQERSPSTAAAAPTNRRSNSRDGRGAVVVPDRRGAVRSSSAITRGLAPAQFVAKEITVVSANPNIAAQLREIAAKEVRVLSHLNHEHIVQYVEQVTEAEKTFIVMEYCAGGDLKSFLAKRKADGVFLKENEVLSMFRQLLRGVAYLHDQHLIHRDIKAANIFLSASGRLKLGDFGLTKDDMATHGLANTVCGTPMYYSPEMCRRVSYDFKTDLWALGCVFYEIMALNHPFEDVSLKDLPKRIINLDYADPK